MIRWTRNRGRHTRMLASVAMMAGAMVAVPAIAHAAPLTIVTIQFDDGNADVIQWATTLNTHGFPATFMSTAAPSARPGTCPGRT